MAFCHSNIKSNEEVFLSHLVTAENTCSHLFKDVKEEAGEYHRDGTDITVSQSAEHTVDFQGSVTRKYLLLLQ